MTAPRYMLVATAGEESESLERIAADIADRHGLGTVDVLPGMILLGSAGLPSSRIGDWLVIGQAHEPLAASPVPPDAPVARLWGDFVAVRRSGASMLVRRAAGGALGAFVERQGRIVRIGSDVAMLATDRPAIAWDALAHHLAFPSLRGRLTGLVGISEILGGTEVDPFDDTPPHVFWSPWSFTQPGLDYRSSAEAEAAIRDTIVDVVAKRVAPAAPVLLELSGGVDSSILAAALRAAARPFAAVNLVTPDREGDERAYAQSVAARLGADLTECPVPANVDLLAPPRRRLALPGVPAMLRPADRLLAALGEERGAPAYMSGAGGDCVFATPFSATPAADAFRRHGPGRRFIRSIADLATLYRASIWATGRMAWRFIRDPDRRRAPVRSTAFLAPERLPDQPQWHPWRDAPSSVPPGKVAHVRAIGAALAHIDGFERQGIAPMLFPLLARPVIEACLRAPSWMWVEGGVTRAVARRAFADRLPPEVIWRQSKGGMDAYCYRNFDACRPRLRPFLLDGHLARAGLLAADEIEAFLAEPPREHDVRFYRLLPIIDAEAWARSWLGDG